MLTRPRSPSRWFGGILGSNLRPLSSRRARVRDQDDKSVYQIEEKRSIARDPHGERFDRIAFALRALEILKPRGMTVAVFAGRFDLQIERGRDWGGGPDATWAMVRIPPDASREHIILALTQLSGVPATPWLLDTLLSHRALGDTPSGRRLAAV
jgi:hypothetical protein